MKSTRSHQGNTCSSSFNGSFPAGRPRQLLKSFHNKSLGDKDSLGPTVYDPLYAHTTMRSDAPMRQADTRVSLPFTAALRNVRWRQA